MGKVTDKYNLRTEASWLPSRPASGSDRRKAMERETMAAELRHREDMAARDRVNKANGHTPDPAAEHEAAIKRAKERHDRMFNAYPAGTKFLKPKTDTPSVLKTEAYAPPTTSQNNIAQQLPVDASQGRVKRMMQKRDVASVADQMQEAMLSESTFTSDRGEYGSKYDSHGVKYEVKKEKGEVYPEVHNVYHNGEHIGYVRPMSWTPYKKIKNSRLVSPMKTRHGFDFHIKREHMHTPGHLRYHQTAEHPTLKSALQGLANHHKANENHWKPTNEETIIQSPEQALDESAMAYKLGREHGMKGHELPAKHIETKHGPGSHAAYMKGIDHAKNPPKKSLLGRMGLTTEGTVKRKYLGVSRGTTATGKPAHQIDVNPVINTRKDMNRTVPSGPKRK